MDEWGVDMLCTASQKAFMLPPGLSMVSVSDKAWEISNQNKSPRFYFSLPAFIDNHDMNRFLFSAHGDLRLVNIALQLLYFLPGQPVVYYGTEAALSQRQSIHEGGALGFDEARLPMPWSEQDNFPLVSLLQQLAKLRRDWQLGEALPLDILQVDDRQQTLVLQRGKLLLTLNRSDEPQTVSFASGAKALKDICTAEVLQTKAGQVQLTLPPLSARFFAADEPC